MMTSSNVLIVEDDAGMRGLLHWMLAERGYAVTEASTVDEAAVALRAGHVDVMILDLVLGSRKSGLEVLRQLRSQGADWLPVIILTGAAIGEEEEEQIRHDEAYVFYKPVDAPELLAYVDRLVRPPLAS